MHLTWFLNSGKLWNNFLDLGAWRSGFETWLFLLLLLWTQIRALSISSFFLTYKMTPIIIFILTHAMNLNLNAYGLMCSSEYNKISYYFLFKFRKLHLKNTHTSIIYLSIYNLKNKKKYLLIPYMSNQNILRETSFIKNPDPPWSQYLTLSKIIWRNIFFEQVLLLLRAHILLHLSSIYFEAVTYFPVKKNFIIFYKDIFLCPSNL